MAMFRYRYAVADPPTPSVLLNIAHPTEERATANLAAIVDTGADQTVLPAAWIANLEVPPWDEQLVAAFDGTPHVLTTHVVRLQVRDFPPFEIIVVGAEGVENGVLGRDVLNRYKIVLDGPRQLLEISDDSA